MILVDLQCLWATMHWPFLMSHFAVRISSLQWDPEIVGISSIESGHTVTALGRAQPELDHALLKPDLTTANLYTNK